MNDWLHIGTLNDIPRQGARVIETSFGNIAVFRTVNDEVFALRDRCPHKAGPLSQGIIHGRRVTCPLHNWVIELGNGAALAPDVGCTQSFPLKLEADALYLQISGAGKCSGLA